MIEEHSNWGNDGGAVVITAVNTEGVYRRGIITSEFYLAVEVAVRIVIRPFMMSVNQLRRQY